MLKNTHCSMAISAEHSTKLAAFHQHWPFSSECSSALGTSLLPIKGCKDLTYASQITAFEQGRICYRVILAMTQDLG